MKTIKIFLASSSELLEDRKSFETFLNRRNNALFEKGIRLKLEIWEDFLDAVSKTRLQDEYNKKIKECDIFIMLFYTKVGMYTEEEFDTAYNQFQATGKPSIFTYFKDVPSDVEPQESLKKFKDRLSDMGHFYTRYESKEGLQLHFIQQLEKLEDKGTEVLDQIKKKVASGDSISKILEKHRAELLLLAPDKDLEITMLQGRATKLEKDIRLGIIRQGDAGVEQARITNSLLSLLDDIKRDLEE